MQKILLLSDTHGFLDRKIKNYILNSDQVWHAGHIGDIKVLNDLASLKPVKSVYKPKLLICGHSHILKVMYDKKNSHLHMNPGAAGIYGFHKIRTMLRFEINKGKIDNLEAIELGPRSVLSNTIN